MDGQIVLSPDLGLAPADFVAAWNEDAECRSVAEVRLPDESVQYDLTTGIVLGIFTGIAANALYDLIKKVLVKKGVTKETEFTQLEKTDGTRLTIVKISEKE